ncbi:MAG: energy transducer TonB [Alphaproteobacteria bacterium]|nr:energy transducer TonB [Alphaproteobacteria bacterium]
MAAFLAATAGAARPTQQTAQQQFDAASSALAGENWAEALRLFQALEARTRDPRTLAIVRVREAGALVGLGRLDEAMALLRTSLPLLPEADASLDEDRFTGLLTLGGIAERALDYDEALRQYRLAAAVRLPELDKLPARRGLVQTLLFSDPEAALREADAALSVVTQNAGNSQLEGAIQTLKGRALLNLGRYGEARAALDRSMRLLGGLTMRVDLADLVARSDLALAALLAGAPDDAKRYLAYTGAGHLEGVLQLSALADPPPCGGELLPSDVAVIQAAVADDGRVVSAMPIYASRRGGSALAFARAVSDWRLRPDSVARIPTLFRTVARFEVRCTQAPRMDSYAEGTNAIRRRMAERDPAWAAQLARLLHLSVPQLRAQLAAAASAADPRTQLPPLVSFALDEAAPLPERRDAARRALGLAGALADSGPLVASLALDSAYLGFAEPDTARSSGRAPDYEALLALPEVAASPRAALEIRLARARHEFHDNHDEHALAEAMAVRDAAGAGADDPIRRQAVELVVAVRAAQGDAGGARAAAALVPHAPVCNSLTRRRRISVGYSDYPNEALRWGFEGWATGEVTIDANGDPQTVRIIAAYPAFVFSDAVARIVRSSRFDPIPAPQGGACPGPSQTIRFILPRE